MKHFSEEELVLYHYGEVEDFAPYREHLAECAACAAQYSELQRVLELAGQQAVPERGDDYGNQVWQRIAPRLSRRPRWLALLAAPRNWALAGAMAGLIVAAFLVGRLSTPRPVAVQPGVSEPARERVLLVAVGDHLDRSQMVLLELVNARPQRTMDISLEKTYAADLVETNRLYRQTAAGTGERDIASVLDELERVLLEIAHSPSEVSGAQLKKIQQRIESQGILFKVRVIGSKVREAEAQPAAPSAQPTL